ncbi:MAG: invasion associated locus B family protein [Paracoccaceae bacterium]
MNDFSKALLLAAALGLALPALAQETAPEAEAPAAETAPAPDSGLPLGEAVTDDGIGSVYVQETSGDWEVRCIRTAEGNDPCQLYQLLKDDKGGQVAEINILSLPSGQQAVAGATVITPLETLLTEQLTFQIDSGEARRYPFTWCQEKLGCVVRMGFTQADLDAMKKGNAATITIVPMVAPDQKVGLTVSLKGFTAGFNAVKAANGH